MDFELPEELRILKSHPARFVSHRADPIERETTDDEQITAISRAFERRARSSASGSSMCRGIWRRATSTLEPRRGVGRVSTIDTGPGEGIPVIRTRHLYSLQGEMRR